MIASGLLLLMGVAIGFVSGEFRDPRGKYPSLKELMLPANEIYSVFEVNSINTQGSNMVASTMYGMTYLDFYANDECTGDVTYSTGYREGLCLPSNDYVRPPLTDEDDYYYKFPFQSLRIHNVTASCDGWYITYYTDVNCTDVYNNTRIEHYTDCRPSTSLKVSNMRSVLGKCSFSQELPIQSDSYIFSDYTGKSGCEQNELVAYTAYGFGTCFGYGNFSSTMFMPNVSAGAVHETQYYSSTNCTRSGSPYGQSDYDIPVGTCNPVKSPNSPNADDDIAYTEYIGLSMVYTSAAPVARPSARPSAKPTMPPTSGASAAPTQNDLVLFAAQQTISGIDIGTYNSNVTAYSLSLRESIAACMTGVSSSNIINLVVTGISSSGVGATSAQRALASSAQISASYQVSVRDATLSYGSLSQQLTSAVQSGQFDTYLAAYGQQTGATGFVGATSTSVTTEDLEDTGNDDKKGFSAGEIAGIVIGSLAVVLILGTLSYFVGQHRTVRRNMSSAPAGGASITSSSGALQVDAHPVDYEDAAAAKARRGPSAASPARSPAHRMEEGGGTVNPLGATK